MEMMECWSERTTGGLYSGIPLEQDNFQSILVSNLLQTLGSCVPSSSWSWLRGLQQTHLHFLTGTPWHKSVAPPPLVCCLSSSVFAYPWPCPRLCTILSGLSDSAQCGSPTADLHLQFFIPQALGISVQTPLESLLLSQTQQSDKRSVFAGNMSSVAVHSLAAECICSFLASYTWPERLKITPNEPLTASSLSPKPKPERMLVKDISQKAWN